MGMAHAVTRTLQSLFRACRRRFGDAEHG